MPIEDGAPYLELLAAFEDEFQPVGPHETHLIQQMASAHWNLDRLERIRTGYFTHRFNKAYEYEHDDEESEYIAMAPTAPPFEPVTPEKEKYDENTRVLGIMFFNNSAGDAFAKLVRYEGQLHRILHENKPADTPAPAPQDAHLHPPAPLSTASQDHPRPLLPALNFQPTATMEVWCAGF